MLLVFHHHSWCWFSRGHHLGLHWNTYIYGQLTTGDVISTTTIGISTSTPVTLSESEDSSFKGNLNIEAILPPPPSTLPEPYQSLLPLPIPPWPSSVSVLGGDLNVTGIADIQGTLNVDTVTSAAGSAGTTTFTGGGPPPD